MGEFLVDVLQILSSALRVATPLIFCAMAGLVSERAGVIDIGLEGKMLMAAFAAAATAAITGSPWLGVAAAVIASGFLALVHGFATITHRGDQIVSGVAINILASGLTVVLGIALFEQGGQSPPLPRDARFGPIDLPFAEALSGIPIAGPIYADLLSGHNVLVYVALAAVPLAAFVLYRTTFGLRLRGVGEAPEAVDSAGHSVPWLRYRAVLIAGLLCGLAGAYLSTAHGAGFVREMSAGKGYIALAALIFGKWRPGLTLVACLLFGFLEAGAARLQGVSLPVIGPVPVELALMAPYVLTVILLAGFIGRAVAPRALGKPHAGRS